MQNESIAAQLRPEFIVGRSPALTDVPRAFACIAFGGAFVSLALMLLLHALRPDLDPRWHVLSEYALGPFGWVMTLCFLCLAAACAGLFGLLLAIARTARDRVGLGFLAAAGAALTAGALFHMDPVTASPDAASFSGTMHELAGIIGVPTFVLSTILLTSALRRQTAWIAYHVPLFALTQLNWIAMVALFGFIGVLMHQHALGGPWFVGWANRILVAAHCGWLMIASWPIARAAAVTRTTTR